MNKNIIDPNQNGFKNEKFFSIAILILIIITIGGFAIVRSDVDLDFSSLTGALTSEQVEEEEPEGEVEEEVEAEEDEEEAEEDTEEEVDEEADEEESVEDNNRSEQEAEEEPVEEEVSDEVVENENSYSVSARSGEGLTHLARRALDEHGGADDLTAEHKVFIEDYIQKHLNRDGYLQMGEEVEIPTELIEEAIQQSENLTESQLENLSQYTHQIA